MPRRGWLAVAAATVTFSSLLSLSAVSSIAAAVPPAVGGAVVVLFALWRVPPGSRLTWLSVVPGGVSAAVTALILVRGEEVSRRDGLHGLLEVAFLAIILAAGVRWLPRPRLWVVAAVTAGAQIVWIVRFLPEREPGPLLLGCAMWSVVSIAALVIGGYPRLAAARLRASVAHARTDQRRALERDMHDFVAHDVTGMIVQAQAARYAAADDPERLRDALARIEESGQRAMSSMDRALRMLRDGAEGSAASQRPGLDDLDRLVSDFRSAGNVAVDLQVVGDAAGLPREIDQTLYRICVEALTNIRRHASTVSLVTIAVTIDDRVATLVVADDGPTTVARRGVRGGTGLRDARGRVEALGGTFEAAPTAGGWRVSASLQL